MKNIASVFDKQSRDMFKNPMVLIMFIIFPVIALIMGNLTDGVPGMEANALMMAGMFAGMAIIQSVTSIIAEDKENQSIKFLTMAGVKPTEYILGISGVILMFGAVSSVAFGLIAGFVGTEFWVFVGLLKAVVIAASLVGGIIALGAGNAQSANGLGTPIGMVFGFVPMIAQFNESVAQWARFVFTQQINAVGMLFMFGGEGVQEQIAESFAVVGGNVLVLLVVFVWVFRKKGI